MLVEAEGAQWVGDWVAQDAGEEYLLFDGQPGNDDQGLWYRHRSSSSADWSEPKRWLPGPYVAAQFEPGARFVAYVNYSANAAERLVEVVSFPDATRKWTVSNRGASRIRWSSDGTRLYWVEGDTLMRSVVAISGTIFEHRAPRPVFAWPGLAFAGNDGASFDVSPDGKRFIVIEPSGAESDARRVVVANNWIEEMKRLVPTE